MSPQVAEAADTQDVSKVGTPIDTAPTTVLEESQLPGGMNKNNQSVGPATPTRAKNNPGLRGRQ